MLPWSSWKKCWKCIRSFWMLKSMSWLLIYSPKQLLGIRHCLCAAVGSVAWLSLKKKSWNFWIWWVREKADSVQTEQMLKMCFAIVDPNQVGASNIDRPRELSSFQSFSSNPIWPSIEKVRFNKMACKSFTCESRFWSCGRQAPACWFVVYLLMVIWLASFDCEFSSLTPNPVIIVIGFCQLSFFWLVQMYFSAESSVCFLDLQFVFGWWMYSIRLPHPYIRQWSFKGGSLLSPEKPSSTKHEAWQWWNPPSFQTVCPESILWNIWVAASDAWNVWCRLVGKSGLCTLLKRVWASSCVLRVWISMYLLGRTMQGMRGALLT